MKRPPATGTFAWLQATHGRLSWGERLRLLQQAVGPTLTNTWSLWTGRGLHRAIDFSAVQLPDSQAVRHALQEADATVSPAVFQHSLRTYYWAAALASIDELAFDAEFLLVACLLHDLGMNARHRVQGCECFACDSACAARNSMIRFGWAVAPSDRLANAISLHMNGPTPWLEGGDAEAHLLQQGAAFDVLGARWNDMHADFKARVLQAHPRLGFNREFADFIAGERQRRPGSRAALMHRAGLPLMLRLNPFDD